MDSTFTKTRGSRVEFGSAGDCYRWVDEIFMTIFRRNFMAFFSSTKCPQGGFSINLKSTGFKISSKQRWKLKGNGGHMEMWRPSSGQEIRARCGGFCARCQPTHANTIQLEFNDL